ncbi:TPA: hypothetical protein DDW35_07840 [Candidatus Sumerlaeota bacterium]|nr:hypothetical protein [Candidatus Sumerlaeota bacterium]
MFGIIWTVALLCGLLIGQAQAVTVKWALLKHTEEVSGTTPVPMGNIGESADANTPGATVTRVAWVGSDGAIYIFWW